MKTIVFALLFLANSVLLAQPYFQKVTNGPVVNDNAWGEGCAWGDYDNDGYQDLVVTNFNDNCWSCSYPILLYHNNGDGSFTKITTGPIATSVTKAFGCSWGDYDNDGLLDLFVCTGFGMNNLLFHNEGCGIFKNMVNSCRDVGPIIRDGGFSVACAWLDYDRDGWLDMFVTNQGNDFLYHNNRHGGFTKITTGPLVTDGINNRSCAVGDYDNDGYPDIVTTAWNGANRLYHNNGNGTFSLTNGIISSVSSYFGGASFGDYDNDGNLDLFIAAFNSGSNQLYHNNGNGTFTQITAGPGAVVGGQGFGCTWVDVDNDGNLDLYVTNWRGTNNILYMNQGNGTFTSVMGDPVCESSWGISNSATDFNMDGRMDLFTANNGSNNTPLNDLLYKNTYQNPTNYIGVKLSGSCQNRSSIGSRITVKAGGRTFIRELCGGEGYHSESMLWKSIGIGNATIVDSIIVRWPRGNITSLAHISPNQYIDIHTLGHKEGNSGTENVTESYSLKPNYPNPFNPSTIIAFEIPSASQTTLNVYDNLGREVATLVNAKLEPGRHEVTFNAQNLSSGVYYYKLISGSYVETRQMILVK